MAPTAESVRSVESVRDRQPSVAVLPGRFTDTSVNSAASSAIRLWVGTIAGLLRSSLAVLFVCVVLAPAARAFEWCPNDLGPDAYCLDGWACCPYPYGPGYWC